MDIPQTEQLPDDPDRLPPARRRRARRLLAPMDADERAAFLSELAHRASPTFDFFFFSALSGLVLCAGLALNSPPIILLGTLLAPFMAPAIGVSLGTVIGSVPFFLRSLAGLLIGCTLVFLAGAIGGVVSRPWQPLSLTLAHMNAQLSWLNFLVLALGAILTTAFFTQPEHSQRRTSAAVSSVALAYGLYLPLAAAGFGLTDGTPHLFPDGLVVFALHLAWSALLGAVTLAVLGFRPLTLFGYTLSGAVALLGVILAIGLSSAGAAFGAQIGIPTPIPTATFTPSPTPTPTLTPVPPTATPTPTLTPTSTRTPTVTPTLTPTPVVAVVLVQVGDGGFIREEPGGQILSTITNGTSVQVLPETEEVDGRVWVRVAAPGGINGWMLLQLLVTATPPTPGN